MHILVRCPKCDVGLPVRGDKAPAAIACGRCGRNIVLTFSGAVRADQSVDICPVCTGADFYARRDFDPTIGLTIVVIGAIVSGSFYAFGRDLIAYSILAGAVLIDLLVYWQLKDVTVCYRCHTEFRGVDERTP